MRAQSEIDRLVGFAAVVALIEIREAIEAQTAVLCQGSAGRDGESAMVAMIALQGRLMELERYTRDVLAGQVTAKLAALEKAVAAGVQHQHETAQLVQTLDGRLDRLAVPLDDLGNVPTAGGTAAADASELASSAGGEPTAG